MATIKYYEEPKNVKGEPGVCDVDSDYGKYRVERSLETLQDAQKILADAKMVGFVKKYLAFQKAQNAEIESQINTETKVGKKLKEVFSG